MEWYWILLISIVVGIPLYAACGKMSVLIYYRNKAEFHEPDASDQFIHMMLGPVALLAMLGVVLGSLPKYLLTGRLSKEGKRYRDKYFETDAELDKMRMRASTLQARLNEVEAAMTQVNKDRNQLALANTELHKILQDRNQEVNTKLEL